MQNDMTQPGSEFRVSKVLLYTGLGFLLLGSIASLQGDLMLGDRLSVVSDSLVLLVTMMALILAGRDRISTNMGLAMGLYAGTANFLVEFVQSMVLAPQGPSSQFFFLLAGIIVFQGVAGFIASRWASLAVGLCATGLLTAGTLVLGDPYYREVFPLLLIILSGYTAILVYYRTGLDRLLVQLRTERDTAEKALSDLQAAQKKIIAQEKLASLGAMTAGIAHEIKNPLNFITNFSESSLELMTELGVYLDKAAVHLSPVDQEELAYLKGELEQNMRDICNHGKRGDHIVKSMLMHSRSGVSAPTREDVNMLAEECLNLAFHGLRAKDSSFQAERQFTPDPSIGMVDMVRGDLGRAFLNMCNNAFYAVHRRAAGESGSWKPRVSMRLALRGERYEVVIEDNGTGMDEATRAKLFTPFFTTKPTGEGTGLGLSMSHEIITRQHGGEIHVDSVPGSHTRFTILLPLKGGPVQ